MSYDRYAAQAPPPQHVRDSLMIDEIANDLITKLGRVPENDRARVEVLRWLMLYLEHRINEPSAGPLRKNIIMRILQPYYRNGDQLADMIDFICANGLCKKRNLAIRLFQVCAGYLRFKLL
jgi:hypothetical protein